MPELCQLVLRHRDLKEEPFLQMSTGQGWRVTMRILFFAGANSIHSRKWIGYFADEGHRILWISLHGGNDDWKVMRISGLSHRVLEWAAFWAQFLNCGA